MENLLEILTAQLVIQSIGFLEVWDEQHIIPFTEITGASLLPQKLFCL